MLIYDLLNVLAVIVFLVAVIYLIWRGYAWKQGDEEVCIETNKRTRFEVEDMSFNQVTLYTDIPVVNKGKQFGTIMDVFPRHLLPQEQFDEVMIASWTTDADRQRHDGYWEAIILKINGKVTIRLRLIFTAKSGHIKKALEGFPHMPIDIIHQVVGRTDYRISKARIVLSPNELQHALRQ